MSEKKVNYGEYMVLGINKAMLAFLISFVLCLAISLVINLHFYQELVAITVGGLGEEANAGAGTILRTAALILGLSTFQTSGKFQLGILILGIIPVISFLVAGRIFRLKTSKKDTKVDLGIRMVVDGLAALIYALFILLSAVVGRGELFGLHVDFVSPRNFGFTVLFIVFLQFFLGGNPHDTFTVFTSGLLRTRKLLRLILSFSALTGILFILYYFTPYVKGAVKIVVLILAVLPNLAVYLSFLLMGITVDLGESFQTLASYLPMLNWNAFVLPDSIRVSLIVAFIIMVLILLVRIPAKQYWQTLIVFVIGYSMSIWLLAMASRVNLGIRGAINIHFEISLWKAFFVPLLLIALDGILLALLRMLCREVKGDQATGVVGAIICGWEAEPAEEPFKAPAEPDFSDDEAEEEDEDEEIDIWKELAARPIPGVEPETGSGAGKDRHEKRNAFDHRIVSPKPAEEKELRNQPIKEPETPTAKISAEKPEREAREKPIRQEPEKEIDISLFPRKKKPILTGFMDFSDMEDDVFVDEYEAEETLEDFVDTEDLLAESMPAEAEMPTETEHTGVIRKEKPAEEAWERTIPYKILHRREADHKK